MASLERARNGELARGKEFRTDATPALPEGRVALEGSDACFAPVLSLDEAPDHPHHRARGTFIDVAGIVQPAPAPRFSRTPAGVPTPPEDPGPDSAAALGDWGFTQAEIAALKAAGALG